MSKPIQQRGADRRRFHYLYKVICKVTGRYYIGMHSTDDMADGYMGSGKRLWQSFRKHGLEQHVKEVLEQLPSREALRLREEQVVSSELIADPMCMNLALGGEGGWDHVNTGPNGWLGKGNWQRSDVQAKNSASAKAKRADQQFADQQDRKISESLITRYRATEHPWKGRTHSAETKNKMSIAGMQRIGQQNPSFGSRWVFNPDTKQAKKVSADEASTLISAGWCFGRKIMGR